MFAARYGLDLYTQFSSKLMLNVWQFVAVIRLSDLHLLSAEAVRMATKCPSCLPTPIFSEVSTFLKRTFLSRYFSGSKKSS